jgi:hypothetical protein
MRVVVEQLDAIDLREKTRVDRRGCRCDERSGLG